MSRLLPAALIAVLIGTSPARADDVQPAKIAKPSTSAPAAAKAAAASRHTGSPTRYLPSRFAGRAGMYYKSVWGVDSLSVKLTESGQIVRFMWRAVEPDKAKALSNREAQPSLIDPQAGVSLVVPTLENIGMMRQSAAPEEGKSYWMAFSNKGRVVKKGDRVNVVIGLFHADGLAVD